MDELLQILEDMRPDVDFASEKELVTGGIIDSFDVVALVGELADQFDIEIGPEYLIPENFDSAEAIWDMIQRIQEDA